MRATILLLLVASAALADQTNSTLVIKTNRVKSVGWYRVVDGQLYNTRASVIWATKTADYISGNGDCAKVQLFTLKPIYGPRPKPQISKSGRAGLFTAGDLNAPVDDYRPIIDWQREDGAVAILRNYSPGQVITEGSALDFSAMKVGTTNITQKNYELWDCGLSNYIQVITTNRSTKVATNSAARKIELPPQP